MRQNTLNRSIVITGASSGIGKACALHFVGLGFTVFAGVRQEEDAEALKQLAPENLVPVYLDVTSSSMIESALVEVTNNLAGRGLTGVVNNAGVPLGGPLEFLSLPDFRREIEVNIIGAVAVTQAFLPLIRHGRGRIVNISSLSGFIALPFIGPYAATKFALRAINDSLRLELRPWGISVSIVEIGNVNTPIWDKALAAIDKAVKKWPQTGWELYGAVLKTRERFQPNGMPPADVARVVEKAMTSRSPKARYVVGRDAKLLDAIRHLPISIRDRVIARQLPKYGPESK